MLPRTPRSRPRRLRAAAAVLVAGAMLALSACGANDPNRNSGAVSNETGPDTTAAAVHDSPKPPPDRLTLTFTGLDAAREIWFVASGDGKADAVSRALDGSSTAAEVPSSRPRGTERTLWLLDRDAAGKLSG